jgi:Cu+-exporting ATPase
MSTLTSTSKDHAALLENACFHCGAPVSGAEWASQNNTFCCQGCLTVFELLTENGLTDFYRFAETAGVRIKAPAELEEFNYLNDASVRRRLVDFENERTTRVTFVVPSVHCIACVWLLENLFRIKPGIGYSRVNFPRKEVVVSFENSKVKLGEVVALLNSLGYGPELFLSDLKDRPRKPAARRLWAQLGVAGFAFGNIMLLSISSYLGLDSFSGPALKKLFGIISLALALPALVYSGADYWRSAWVALHRRILTLDVPIALGLLALASWSTREAVLGRGPGYFDSLTGLLFFLLCGKLFQQKTYDRLAFDRDYTSFFPLSILRRRGEHEERISLSQLQLGDHLVIRNGELIPSDSRLISDGAMIDYSFVTGESEAIEKGVGDYIYAGGRQIGAAIEIETVKEVSQGYLTSLWNQEAFSRKTESSLESLTNRYSRRFTKIVLCVAVGSAIFWAWRNPARSVTAFVSVLIVACPCALALAAPFTLGTAQRVLGRRNVFLKNPSVIEMLARVNSVVFDKTGTLTAPGAGTIVFRGEPLRDDDKCRIYSLAQHSTHPQAARIAESLEGLCHAQPVRSFSETTGCGIEGLVAGQELWMGSAAWIESHGVAVEMSKSTTSSVVHVVINGIYRGCYNLSHSLRPDAAELIRKLSAHCNVALLSGDNESQREQFIRVFGDAGNLHFNQSPLHKLNFVSGIQTPEKSS